VERAAESRVAAGDERSERALDAAGRPRDRPADEGAPTVLKDPSAVRRDVPGSPFSDAIDHA
jgi:hypothetical protein